MKNVIMTVSDKNYIDHTGYLFGALRTRGRWMGELALVSNGLSESEIAEFRTKGVTVYEEPLEDYNWAKTKIFKPEICRNYDRILYLDQDVVVFKPVDPLFEEPGDFLSDSDSKVIRQEFDEISNPELFARLSRDIDVELPAFCCGVMRFDSKIIPDDIMISLELIRNEYRAINNLNGIKNGMAEQPILNVVFGTMWKQMQGERFWNKREFDTIITHNTKWYAPWLPGKELREMYLDCLDYYRRIM